MRQSLRSVSYTNSGPNNQQANRLTANRCTFLEGTFLLFLTQCPKNSQKLQTHVVQLDTKSTNEEFSVSYKSKQQQKPEEF